MLSLGPEGGVLLFAGQTASPPADGEELDDTWLYSHGDPWVALGTEAPWGDAVAYDVQSAWEGPDVDARWTRHRSTGLELGPP